MKWSYGIVRATYEIFEIRSRDTYSKYIERAFERIDSLDPVIFVFYTPSTVHTFDTWFNFYGPKRRYTIYIPYQIFLLANVGDIDSFAFRTRIARKDRYEKKLVFLEKRRSTEIRLDGRDGDALRSSPPCPWARWR